MWALSLSRCIVQSPFVWTLPAANVVKSRGARVQTADNFFFLREQQFGITTNTQQRLNPTFGSWNAETFVRFDKLVIGIPHFKVRVKVSCNDRLLLSLVKTIYTSGLDKWDPGFLSTPSTVMIYVLLFLVVWFYVSSGRQHPIYNSNALGIAPPFAAPVCCP